MNHIFSAFPNPKQPPFSFIRAGFDLGWDGICHVDPEPSDPGPVPDNGGVGDLQSQINELQKQNQAYAGIIEKLRPVERQYKKLEALLGDTDPEKLQQLREADTRLKQQEEVLQAKILEAQNKTAAEYKQQIEALQKQNSSFQETAEGQKLTFDIFRAFNLSEGIGDRFEGFMELSKRSFERTTGGEIHVKDDAGKQVTFKDEQGNVRPATPAEFMKLLASDDLEGYTFQNKSLMQHSFAPYNRARGAGLPSGNGHDIPKNLSELPQSELFKYAFKNQ
jgi:hypothetical protein